MLNRDHADYALADHHRHAHPRLDRRARGQADIETQPARLSIDIAAQQQWFTVAANVKSEPVSAALPPIGIWQLRNLTVFVRAQEIDLVQRLIKSHNG